MIHKHPKMLLVIVAEAVLEKPLVRDVQAHGAQGWTVTEVHGAGHDGWRHGAWEADRTIQLQVICDEPVADAIAEYVLATYGANYGLALWFSPVAVLRPERF